MSNYFSSKHSMHVLEKRNEDQLILRTGGIAGFMGNALLLLGLVFLVAGFFNPAGWFYGPFFLFFGCLTRFGPHTTLLDRRKGVLKIRRFQFRHEYPLSQIQDVRVIRGRYVVPIRTSSVADRSYQSYQTVLSFDNPFVGRMVLLENGDGPAQEQYAKEIARFLAVPYFDERNQFATSDSQEPTAERYRPKPTTPEEIEKYEKQDRWALIRAERKAKGREKRKRTKEG